MEKNLFRWPDAFELKVNQSRNTGRIDFYHQYGHFQVVERRCTRFFYVTTLKATLLSVVFSGSSKEAVEEAAKSVTNIRRLPANSSKL